MKALSVQQPWAYFLFHGKPVENRTWHHNYRGPLLIHAGKTFDYDGGLWIWENRGQLGLHMSVMPAMQDFARRAFIGQVTFKNTCRRSESPWFFGPWGFNFVDPVEFAEPIPWMKGQLGIFDVPDEVIERTVKP